MSYKQKIRKLALLLLAAAASGGARAQVTLLEPRMTYVLTNIAPAVSESYTYQWYRNGQPISGATSADYILPANLAQGTYVEFKRGVKAPDCGEYSFSNSIIVSFCGLLLTDNNAYTCWASANVNAPVTFADRPDAYGWLYQWNRVGVGWDALPNTSSSWTYNPCPTGWRIPSQSEFNALLAAGSGSTWADAYAKNNLVPGRFFGPNHAACTLNSMVGCLFFPAAGTCDEMATVSDLGTYGNYWTRTQSNNFTSRGYTLHFSSTSSATITDRNKADGANIRCVME